MNRRWRLLAGILAAVLAFTQADAATRSSVDGVFKSSGHGGGGGGGPTVVGSVSAASTNGNTFTTGGISLSATASITWIASSWYRGGPATTVTSSNSATITCLTAFQAASVASIQICYTTDPIPTGTTFTSTNSGSFASLCVVAFTGLTAYDSPNENGATGGSVATFQPGSVTPTSGSANVVITATALPDNSGASPPTISAGYTIDATSVHTANSEGCSIAHKPSVVGAENPTWTYNATPTDTAAADAVAKP